MSDDPGIRGQHQPVHMRPEVRFRRFGPLRRAYARWRELPDVAALEARGLALGGNVRIQPWVHIDEDFPELITIGSNSGLSLRVILMAHDPARSDEQGRPWTAPVTIGERVFVGAGSIVLPGTAIGDRSIVGAGSVVQGSFREGSVIAGNPATVVGSTEDYIERHRARRRDEPANYAR